VEPVGGVAGLEVWSRTAVSFSNIRSRQMLTASIVVSGTEGLIGYAVMDGVGVIYLRPTGTALRVYSLCLAFAGGGDGEIPPPGMCPAPRAAGWTFQCHHGVPASGTRALAIRPPEDRASPRPRPR